MENIQNYINGNWIASESLNQMDITNPSNGEIIGTVQISLEIEVEAAVEAAAKAFEEWRNVPVGKRCSYLFKLQQLMTQKSEELARTIAMECGKTLVDAKAELKRAIQNVEVACGMPMLMQGEKLEGIAAEMDGEVIRQPLGVFGIIAPFNFPAMVPFWFLPYAIATGNTVVIKPSEQVPVTMKKIFELIDTLGLPEGVVNMVNGDFTVSQTLVKSTKVKGISFVGSSNVAKTIASACVQNGKRFQALGSAKNYLVVMEDAKLDKVVESLLTSCYGCAGQRCMATSIVAAVPQIYEELKVKLLTEAKRLKVGDALDATAEVGPVISIKSKNRILDLINKGIEEGANLLLDGRNVIIPEELKDGYYIGPTIFSEVEPEMIITKEEIFGPVASLMKIQSLDEGLKLIENSKYGNGASIFTQNGYYARKFEMEVNAGMVGINVGIPAPVAYFPFGGVKESMYGDVKAQGRDVVNFFTERKVVTVRFFKEP